MSSGSNFRFDSLHALSASMSNDCRTLLAVRISDHAHQMVACDFFVSVTACFRLLYVFVALEIGSRRLIHFNLTEHPTADWTLQQRREALPAIRITSFC